MSTSASTILRSRQPMSGTTTTILLIATVFIAAGAGIGTVSARKHELVLEAADRPSILITIFDFLRDGSLSVNLNNITITDKNETAAGIVNVTNAGAGPRPDYGKYDGRVGFVLDRTSGAGTGPYFSTAATADKTSNGCPFKEHEEVAIFTDNNEPGLIQRIIFPFNFKKKDYPGSKPGCNRSNRSLRRDVLVVWDSITAENCTRRSRIKDLSNTPKPTPVTMPLPYSMKFNISMLSDRSVGLYSLYFVHCNSSNSSRSELVALNMTVVAKNKIQPRDLFFSSSKDSFLYFFMGALFFGAGIYWAFYFRGTCSNEESGQVILRIHYLMLVLVVLKSLTLLFLAGHIHHLERYGEHKATWSVPYFISKILTSVLTFAVILLIETGLAFTAFVSTTTKPRFSPKVFMIMAVLVLQIMASVAEIITEESEAGQSIHYTSRIISMTMNSVSIGIVLLYPVVRKCYRNPVVGGGGGGGSNGSAFDTEGILRARVCTKKLKIFRRFYFVVFCYFYITRIWFGSLVPLMLSPNYDWMAEAGTEITTLVVFGIIGYMFGPARNNAYLTLGNGMDDTNEVAFS